MDDSTVAMTRTQVAEQHIGRYRIIRRLGKGGMAAVFLAHHPTLRVDVALKTILPAHASDPYFRRKFLEEGRKQAQLNHPHILTVHDSDEANNELFLVTEYADGGTLRGWLDAGRYSTLEALDCMRKLAEALAHAHSRANPVMHLDFKPTNVLMVNGQPKLADFGIARILSEQETELSKVAVNMKYCAPEQLQGKPAPQSDVYALGMVLWEMLLRDTPQKLAVAGRGDRDLVTQTLPECPEGVAALLCRCLSVRPQDRPSAADVATRLREIVAAEQPRRGPWFVLLGIGLLAVAAVAYGPARAWLAATYATIFPPAQQAIAFDVEPRDAQVWIGTQPLAGDSVVLDAGLHQVAITAPGYVGRTLTLEVPQLPATPVAAALPRRPDTIDLEYLAFIDALQRGDSGPLWTTDWQDPALRTTRNLLRRSRDGEELTAPLERLRLLANAADAVSATSLYLLLGLGVHADADGVIPALERSAGDGDPLSAVLLARHHWTLADDPATDRRQAEVHLSRSQRYLERAAQLGMRDTVAVIGRR